MTFAIHLMMGPCKALYSIVPPKKICRDFGLFIREGEGVFSLRCMRAPDSK